MQVTGKHPRHNFLVERIAFFSDAIFAIAITLMIIEIHPPKVAHGETDAEAWSNFEHLLPEFLGLFVSFWLIGSSWLRHHHLFRYVDNFDSKFMTVNLILLFFIILFPFSTSYLFNSLFNGGVTRLQVFFYLGVPFFANVVLLLMYKQVNRRHLKGTADRGFHIAISYQWSMVISFGLAILWIAVMPFTLHPFGYMFLGLIPLLPMIFRKKIKTHAQPTRSAADQERS